jgi:hypothetical protein
MQSQDDVDEFLKSVFSFLKRNTSYMGQDGSDKAIAKIARQFQPSSKVCCLVMLHRTSGCVHRHQSTRVFTLPRVTDTVRLKPSCLLLAYMSIIGHKVKS